MLIDMGLLKAGAEVLFALLVGIIGYLLARRDAQQEKLIDDLYNKHNDDVARLNVLALKLAEDHYKKPEIHQIIDSVKQSLDKLSGKFDVLNAALLARASQYRHDDSHRSGD